MEMHRLPKWYLIWLFAAAMQFGFGFLPLRGQQTYVANHQLDCYNTNFDSTTKGYLYNGLKSTCQSYLTFRADPPYNTPVAIAALLNSDPTLIASINNISSVRSIIPTFDQVVVPINCSRYQSYYQHNTTYELRSTSETYFILANNTYQGLSTCQAMMSQNPYGDRNLIVGSLLLVPLRCACPTSNQTAAGVKYLLTYMVTWGNTISAIADTFSVDQSSLLEANKLTSGELIFPFTPLLVPLTTEPTKIQPVVPSPPPVEPPQLPADTTGGSHSSHKWVFVGVSVGIAFLLFVSLSGFMFCFYRHRSQRDKPIPSSGPKKLSDSADYAALPDNNSWSLSLSSDGVRYAIESLTIYKFEDLQSATGSFSESNRIEGSVYQGTFKGDYAAVKVMKGDVSAEINLLKKINHSNVVRLSGICVHEGNTYLVYEYADNGSVSDWLQPKKHKKSSTLAWKQRVQIACDVADALNYLHNYTNPPCIHKNLKSSNILLDANFRAKIGNFGLARTVNNNEDDDLQLTRHVVGTQGYMAPEYIENGLITPKLDVFAFGVVMLELLSGREATTVEKNSREGLLYASISGVLEGDNVRVKLQGFIDPSLRNEYPLDLAFSMAQLAQSCVAHDLNARLSMPEILMTLSKILSSSLDWDPSDELDRSRSFSSAR